MIRLALLLICLAVPVAAQDAPQVTAELSAEETMLGQPLVLRVKVLVPSFMPSPPVFPDLEVPGLLIRLPERASSPTSETIDGESWSGVQRAYRLYPLVPGQIVLPPAAIRVTWAGASASDPQTADVPLPEIRFTSTVPGAARDLDPLILASGFTLEEELELPDDLAVGGAATRVVTATIDGATPILIPPLSTDTAEGMRIYADEPQVSERDERGVQSGSRSERIVYLPEASGTLQLPAIGFDWFNIDNGEVERAELPAHEIEVAPGPEPARLPPDPRQIALIAGALLAALALLALAWRYALPALRRRLAERRARRLASEPHAARQVQAALKARDLDAVNRSLDMWLTRVPPVSTDAMTDALAAIGAARYGPRPGGSEAASWSGAAKAFASLRRQATARPDAASALPALNP